MGKFKRINLMDKDRKLEIADILKHRISFVNDFVEEHNESNNDVDLVEDEDYQEVLKEYAISSYKLLAFIAIKKLREK